MEAPPRSANLRWYRTLYWRIGFGFLALITGLLVLQNLLFSFIVMRSRETLPGGSPNRFAALVAADLASDLAAQADLDLQRAVQEQYGAVLSPVYVVMKDGRIAGNSTEPLPENILKAAAFSLGGIEGAPTPRAEDITGPPVVMVPIKIGSTLAGLVIVPPRRPFGGSFWDAGRLLSIPGLLLLLAATGAAAAFIVGPARRRLGDLELVTERLGAGDLSARASEEGGDEVARLARSFNRMAGELSIRDDSLRTADRLRRQMLADVSHELKTPLTSMRGYLETIRMLDRTIDAETRDRYLQTVEHETLRLERIVKDLLDLARFENGVATLDSRVFAIDRVFERVAARHEREAASLAVQLRRTVNPTADQIVGDPDRIEQVIDNLVANALRHSPEGGIVEMCASLDGPAARLTVSDSGGGIAPEHLPHVFERFYKVDQARANGSGGSGLGLSIARAIVEGHHGTIAVRSAPGKTVFTVTLPLQSESANL